MTSQHEDEGPLMPQPGLGTEAPTPDEELMPHRTEDARAAAAAEASDVPLGASQPSWQARDTRTQGKDDPAAEAREAPAAQLPNAAILDRPEGRTQRLRMAYRSLWRWWLLGGLGAGLLIQPAWPLRVAGGELPQVREFLGGGSYELIIAGLSWAGLGAIALAGLVIAYERLAARYLLYPEQVAEERGLIARRVSRVDLRHVRTVDVEQSLIDRLLGVGTIRFASAGTASTDVAWGRIAQPVQVQHQVMARMREFGRAAEEPG